MQDLILQSELKKGFISWQVSQRYKEAEHDQCYHIDPQNTGKKRDKEKLARQLEEAEGVTGYKSFKKYLGRANTAEGPNRSRLKDVKDKPTIIIKLPWSYLSESQPQNGLGIV